MQRNFLGEELFLASKEKEIVGFKYHGSNVSLLYNNVTGPFAQWIVDHVFPPWLA